MGKFGDKSIAFLTSQMDRLGIPQDQRESFINNMYDFSRQVRNIESDNDPMRVPGIEGNTAKGVYQFTDDSVVTGKNRMETLGYAERPGWNPYTDEYISSISDNPQEWTDEHADDMFLANIFAQTGSDRYITDIGRGNIDARKDAYYQFHHTRPDDATIRRVDKEMLVDNILTEQGADAF
tara:strand:- start:4908 stop:5447 length:540 start_codon:yes stop_codon:yes gene_type:complete